MEQVYIEYAPEIRVHSTSQEASQSINPCGASISHTFVGILFVLTPYTLYISQQTQNHHQEGIESRVDSSSFLYTVMPVNSCPIMDVVG